MNKIKLLLQPALWVMHLQRGGFGQPCAGECSQV